MLAGGVWPNPRDWFCTFGQFAGSPGVRRSGAKPEGVAIPAKAGLNGVWPIFCLKNLDRRTNVIDEP